MKNLTNEARKELISKVIETIQENDLEGLYVEELHQRAFNQDYYIIGYYEAEKWLVANYGVFEAIEKIQEYEENNFGEVNTNLGNSESVCNMLTYILGEEIIQDLNIKGDKFTKKELKRIEKELKELVNN